MVNDLICYISDLLDPSSGKLSDKWKYFVCEIWSNEDYSFATISSVSCSGDRTPPRGSVESIRVCLRPIFNLSLVDDKSEKIILSRLLSLSLPINLVFVLVSDEMNLGELNDSGSETLFVNFSVWCGADVFNKLITSSSVKKLDSFKDPTFWIKG